MQTQITTDILTLEILTHTPILTNSTTEITLDSSMQKTEKQIAKENRAVEKRIKKAAKEAVNNITNDTKSTVSQQTETTVSEPTSTTVSSVSESSDNNSAAKSSSSSSSSNQTNFVPKHEFKNA